MRKASGIPRVTDAKTKKEIEYKNEIYVIEYRELPWGEAGRTMEGEVRIDKDGKRFVDLKDMSEVTIERMKKMLVSINGTAVVKGTIENLPETFGDLVAEAIGATIKGADKKK
jgi:hypothetical protein